MPSKLKSSAQSAIFADFWGEGGDEQEALALLSKKGVGREGSIESQQKFDFFCYDITPYYISSSCFNIIKPDFGGEKCNSDFL